MSHSFAVVSGVGSCKGEMCLHTIHPCPLQIVQFKNLKSIFLAASTSRSPQLEHLGQTNTLNLPGFHGALRTFRIALTYKLQIRELSGNPDTEWPFV